MATTRLQLDARTTSNVETVIGLEPGLAKEDELLRKRFRVGPDRISRQQFGRQHIRVDARTGACLISMQQCMASLADVEIVR